VAGGYAGGVEAAERRGRVPGDAATALVLVACLAGGVVLASDVLDVGAGVDRLLFGTLVGLERTDLVLAALAAAVAVASTALVGRAWLASAFDPGAARTIGLPTAAVDALLLVIVALVVVSALSAVGTLLVSALFVLPAATAVLFARTVGRLLAGAVAVAAVQGVAGLYLAYWLDVPPGPALAVLGGGMYALAAVTRTASRARTGVAPA
jgi:manganese/iron transport system permease protein